MLTKREETILKIIVSEYISSATPVPSEGIASRYNLKVSPATIRNEMARLAEEGYISRPHISAGGIPADKGYRYYVERLVEEVRITPDEEQAVRELFQQVEQRLEEWMRLATTVLAQRLRGLAVAVLPGVRECHFKHVELVALQEYLVLLILVLQEVRTRQQLFYLDRALSQDELTPIANKLNTLCRGLTSSQIKARQFRLSPAEEPACARVVQLMEAEDERQYEELYFDGLRHLLAQPEFATAKKMLTIMEALEEKRLLRNLLRIHSGEPGVRVTIGRENQEEALQDCSVILQSYGIPDRTWGTIGVIGPTRMPYNRAIQMLNCLSLVMSELLEELYA